MSEFDFSSSRPGIPMEDDSIIARHPLTDASSRISDDEIERSLRPSSLEDFVGQPRVREQLRVFIDAAKHRDEALDHALFAGPPGLGKCVTPDTMVFTTHGLEPIGDLGVMGGESWQPITRPIAGLYGTRTADYFYDNGESSTLRITTTSGYRVEGTLNHPVLIRDESGAMKFCRLDELHLGDQVAIRLGAQVFGKETKLHTENLGLPTLRDPARIPDTLEPMLARLLGLLLVGGRLMPNDEGVIYVSKSRDKADEVARCVKDIFCAELELIGDGPFGSRWSIKSQRIAAFLRQIGLELEGFMGVPSCICKAPRILVAEFVRGVFWGVEHAPVAAHKNRTAIAHLQLLLANFGIESRIKPSEIGWSLSASSEPSSYNVFDTQADSVEDPYQEVGGHHHGQTPNSDHDGESLTGAMSNAGFGMTPAGVLVAVASESQETYRRGMTSSNDLVPVRILNEGRVYVESVTVAEVDPVERGRALVREARSDHRELAVRSVRSKLRREEVVELAWESVESIEPGYAYTVDVSVPDGHTFIGNGIICHNTTLANVVANELGSTLHTTSGPALEKKADVAAILTNLGPKDVLFIDEIHRLSTAIEEILYTAMEDYQIDIVLGQGPAARTLRLDLEPFTLVGATTRTGLLTTPLRDRFGITQRLEYYSVDELIGVVLRSAKLLDLSIDSDAAKEIASRSRGTPRIANRLLRRVRDVAQVRHEGALTLDVAQEALDLVDIDALGLDRIDRMVLEVILTKFAGGPVGLSTLAIAVGEEAHTIEDVYEPFLLQRGFIQRTPRGRIITELGRAHLGASGYKDIRPDELF